MVQIVQNMLTVAAVGIPLRRYYMKPVLDPKRDLKGATPEKLARALFRRNEPLRPRARGKAIVGDKVSVKKIATDHSGNRVSHLRKRS